MVRHAWEKIHVHSATWLAITLYSRTDLLYICCKQWKEGGTLLLLQMVMFVFSRCSAMLRPSVPSLLMTTKVKAGNSSTLGYSFVHVCKYMRTNAFHDKSMLRSQYCICL